MIITHFSEADQLPGIEQHNSNLRGLDRIPVVPRNFETGWPLLQVSFFSPIVTSGKLMYEPALGGGKCHFFPIPLFNMATLLMSIPGKVTITGNENAVINERERVRLDNINSFLTAFKIKHHVIGLDLELDHGPYGVVTRITGETAEWNTKRLEHRLSDAFLWAVKHGAKIENIPGWQDMGIVYSPEQINEEINTDVATFVNGQIFVDLGTFLDTIENQALKDYFKSIFKVDEFLELKNSSPDFKPKIVTEELSESPEPNGHNAQNDDLSSAVDELKTVQMETAVRPEAFIERILNYTPKSVGISPSGNFRIELDNSKQADLVVDILTNFGALRLDIAKNVEVKKDKKFKVHSADAKTVSIAANNVYALMHDKLDMPKEAIERFYAEHLRKQYNYSTVEFTGEGINLDGVAYTLDECLASKFSNGTSKAKNFFARFAFASENRGIIDSKGLAPALQRIIQNKNLEPAASYGFSF